ncbi:hypothetical protein L2E82_26977 [Cichorium intybus]|uniref:Uncharacterized protein n=1 Tax=Cichorium intybus TaxID=13427 RepID=A0ACB9CRZ9_CICIN|nr:hypothetical protein L2E82_26977 [Cichorium intybus]
MFKLFPFVIISTLVLCHVVFRLLREIVSVGLQTFIDPLLLVRDMNKEVLTRSRERVKDGDRTLENKVEISLTHKLKSNGIGGAS